jgi:oxygen-independent coproporphyrinogen III oxidase
MNAVFDAVQNNFSFSGSLETTIEANPNSITQEKLRLWKQQGVNRLSLGVQSFSDEILIKLGRAHTSSQASDAVLLARETGYRNISLDLIYGIPGQTMEQWMMSLETAITMKPEHLSVYALSLDDGSRLKNDIASGIAAPLDDDAAADQYEAAATILAEAGYVRYEISNFCFPGFECRHNLNYWERGEYLGLGPSAWSFYDRRRYRTIQQCKEYIDRLADGLPIIDFEESFSMDLEVRETILLRLRTRQGLDLNSFKKAFGDSRLDQFIDRMEPLCRAGLMTCSNNRAMLSDRGFLLSNEALSRLIG